MAGNLTLAFPRSPCIFGFSGARRQSFFFYLWSANEEQRRAPSLEPKHRSRCLQWAKTSAEDAFAPDTLFLLSSFLVSEKNRDLSDAEITAVTDRFTIDRKRPLLVQISRFDHFKDPLGVIAAYR